MSTRLSPFPRLPVRGRPAHTHVRRGYAGPLWVPFRGQLFEKLIGVSNIGLGLAIKVLSGIDAADLLTTPSAREIERLGMYSRRWQARCRPRTARYKLPAPSRQCARAARRFPNLTTMGGAPPTWVAHVAAGKPGAPQGAGGWCAGCLWSSLFRKARSWSANACRRCQIAPDLAFGSEDERQFEAGSAPAAFGRFHRAG